LLLVLAKLLRLLTIKQQEFVPLTDGCAFQAVFEFFGYCFSVVRICHSISHRSNVQSQYISLRAPKASNWRINADPNFRFDEPCKHEAEDNIVQDVFEAADELR